MSVPEYWDNLEQERGWMVSMTGYWDILEQKGVDIGIFQSRREDGQSQSQDILE